jgi:hypothetical protein
MVLNRLGPPLESADASDDGVAHLTLTSSVDPCGVLGNEPRVSACPPTNGIDTVGEAGVVSESPGCSGAASSPCVG